MAIRMQESPDSRDLHYGASGGGMTFRLTAVTTAGETESQVWLYALTQSQPYFAGFIRNDIKVRRQSGPNLFTVEIEYGTTGVGGGDQPLGGTGNDGGPPNTPTAPAEEATTPLTSGYSFTVSVPRLHITQSLATTQAVGLGGTIPVDYKGAIGVSKDGKIEGCDVPPEGPLAWSRTVARPNVTVAYLKTLKAIAGRPNDQKFYHFDVGECLYMGANGTFTEGEGWSITHQFAAGVNETDIVIRDGLTVPLKLAFEYLWVSYKDFDVAGQVVTLPAAAYVEAVLAPANFALIDIGV